jgi:hypothetical protein
MLIHENDRNQDGVYDDLWLLSSAPQAWVAYGKSISLENMPSRFGRVSLKLASSLSKGKLIGEVTLPAGIEGKNVLLFLPLPEGHRVLKASLDSGVPLKISAQDGESTIMLMPKPGTTHFTVWEQ